MTNPEKVSESDLFCANLEHGLQALAYVRQIEHPTYAKIDWNDDKVTIDRITVREVTSEKRGTERDDNRRITSRLLTIEYQEWSSNTPTEEPITSTVTKQGKEVQRLENNARTANFGDKFRGKNTAPRSLLIPILEHTDHVSDDQYRDILKATIETGATEELEYKSFLRYLRVKILGDYGPDGIDRYQQIIQGIEDVPSVLTKQAVGRVIIAQLVHTTSPKGQGTITPQLAEEQVYASARKVDDMGVFDDTALNSRFAYRNFAFSQILHARLRAGKGPEVLRGVRQSPLDFTLGYMSMVFEAHENSEQRDEVKSRAAYEATRENSTQTVVNPSKVFELANHLTALRNKSSGQQEEQLSLSSIQDFRNLGRAFFKVLSVTASNDPEVRRRQMTADRVHAEIVDMLIELTVDHELKRYMPTRGHRTKRGVRTDPQTQKYAELRRQHGSGVRWDRKSPGYGILS
jgi:hypothetical protein